jgi:uncharacterized integral membrane protein
MKVKTILILGALLSILLYQNNKLVDFSFLWMNFQIQLWIIIGLSSTIGFVVGLILKSKQMVGTEPALKNIHRNEDEGYLN